MFRTLYLSNQFAFSNIFWERNQRHIQFTFISQKNEIAETYASFKMPQAVEKQLNKIFVEKARQTLVLGYASCNCFNLVYLVLWRSVYKKDLQSIGQEWPNHGQFEFCSRGFLTLWKYISVGIVALIIIVNLLKCGFSRAIACFNSNVDLINAQEHFEKHFKSSRVFRVRGKIVPRRIECEFHFVNQREWASEGFFPGGPKVVKIGLYPSKLKKQPFLLIISKSNGGLCPPCPLPTPMLTQTKERSNGFCATGDVMLRLCLFLACAASAMQWASLWGERYKQKSPNCAPQG